MIYLDNAATSWPKPAGVAEAVVRALREPLGNPGRTHHRAALDAASMVAACREDLAELFHAPNPLRICFTANTTDALHLAIKGALRPGDHAICSAMEHNSVWRPLKALAEMGVELSVAEAGQTGFVHPENVRRLLRPNTRLVVMQHASNVTGTIQAIQEIGAIVRAHGALFLVDAAQSAGSLPIDVVSMSIDLLAFPGHKGLLGPQGTGGLYVGEGVELQLVREGGTGSESLNAEQPSFYPDRLESGTLNVPGIAGLDASVTYLLARGVSSVRKHETGLTVQLLRGLARIPGVTLYGPAVDTPRAAVVSFNLEGWECTALAEELERRAGIASRPGIHCAGLAHRTLGTAAIGTVRLSPGPFTSPEEIETALAVVEAIAREPRDLCPR
ncbi:MAG: aminotransferase class V-fold PLP-dependent enzyme [Acidobacteriota bacterium]|nr:aminotransferase class V-fold PLP-dependent enzyme [Acidobacteriota bacterium]